MNDRASGACRAYSANVAQTSWMAVAGNARKPRWRCGPNGWSRNSNAVAMPKFQPAPRRPQKSSGSSSAVARSSRPSAVTSSTAVRLSIVSPKCRCSRPDAAAQREPGDPGVTDDADRAHEAVCLRRDLELPEQRTTVHAGGPRRRIDLDAAHRGQVDDQAAVVADQPGGGVTARPDRDLQALVAPERDRGGDPCPRSSAVR